MPRQCISLRESKCLFCQQCLVAGERCIAALGTTSFIGFTDAFKIPIVGQMNQQYARVYLNGQVEAQESLLCYRLRCDSCDRSFNSYIGHQDCIPKKITYEALWDIGHAINPWFPSPTREPIFRPSKDVLPMYIGRRFADLPNELFQMILWEYVPCSALSRLGIALQFNTDLINTLRSIRKPPTEFDFTDPALRAFKFDFLGIHYCPFATDKTPVTETSVIRLTVDHLGIRAVEILSEYPIARTRKSRIGLWYIVEYFCYARQKFKLVSSGPFLRLKEYCQDGFQMWDVDSPFEYGSYSSVGRFTTSLHRIRSIETSNITALTIFCTAEHTFGIYAHNANESAIATYQNLYETTKDICMWRHFPLQQGEAIVKAWIYEGQGSTSGTVLAVYTSHGRSCFFGAPSFIRQSSCRPLCDSAMTNLLYGEPASGEAISWFGATPKLSSASVAQPLNPAGEPHMQLTYASLGDVVQAEIYSDDEGASTGALFKYADGSLESVGQRRVGLSTTTVTRVDFPKWACVREFEIPTRDHRNLFCKRKCVEVHFSSRDCEPYLSNKEWRTQPMVGRVFWAFKLRRDIVRLLIN